MKQCSKCGEDKPLDKFPKSNNGKGGYNSACKQCKVDDQKTRRRSDPETYNQKQTDYRYSNPDRQKKVQNQNYKSKYGLSLEEVEIAKKRQRYRCAVCRRAGKRLVVDHNHITGKFRAMLCDRCNMNAVPLAENPELYKRALEYVRNDGLDWSSLLWLPLPNERPEGQEEQPDE